MADRTTTPAADPAEPVAGADQADQARSTLLPVATDGAALRRMWAMLRGRRLRLAGVLLLFLAEATTAVVFPLVLGRLVDTVIGADGTGVPAEFWWQVGLLAAAALAAGVLGWAGAVSLARIAETVIAELREAYVTAALGLPRATIEAAGTGDVVTRASDDIAQVSGTLPDVLPRVAVSGFTVVLVGVGLAGLDPWFLAAFAITVPLYGLTLRWYLRTAPPVYAAERAAQSERGQHVLGTLTALPTVTAHRLEQRQLRRIETAAWRTVRWAMRTRIVQNRLFGRLNLTEAVGLTAVLAVGVWLAFAGATTPGDVTAAALLFLRTVAPIAALMYVMDDLQSAIAALGRLVGVVEHRGAEAPPAEVVREPTGDGALVRVTEVSFSYDGRVEVLSGVSLHLDPGETVAVVGATGSGKSTLASLVAGVHQPSRGGISRAVPVEQVLSVAQESHVFAAKLRDNLTLADPAASDATLARALDRAGAARLARDLPEGLDTPVGHGGHPLAPAAAQHLALARLGLADPAVIVLDEATADAGTADTAVLEQAAAAVGEGRAALVIAHRLSQAAAADRIVVIDAGAVVETGTHADLLAARGTYARLWRAWQSGRPPPAP